MDEEIFEDLRAAVHHIGKKKFYLDSLQIKIDDEDQMNFLALYSFPNQLKFQLNKKQAELSE